MFFSMVMPFLGLLPLLVLLGTLFCSNFCVLPYSTKLYKAQRGSHSLVSVAFLKEEDSRSSLDTGEWLFVRSFFEPSPTRRKTQNNRVGG